MTSPCEQSLKRSGTCESPLVSGAAVTLAQFDPMSRFVYPFLKIVIEIVILRSLECQSAPR